MSRPSRPWFSMSTPPEIVDWNEGVELFNNNKFIEAAEKFKNAADCFNEVGEKEEAFKLVAYCYNQVGCHEEAAQAHYKTKAGQDAITSAKNSLLMLGKDCFENRETSLLLNLPLASKEGVSGFFWVVLLAIPVIVFNIFAYIPNLLTTNNKTKSVIHPDMLNKHIKQVIENIEKSGLHKITKAALTEKLKSFNEEIDNNYQNKKGFLKATRNNDRYVDQQTVESRIQDMIGVLEKLAQPPAQQTSQPPPTDTPTH